MNWVVQLLACAVAASCFSVLLHQPRPTIPASTMIATAGYAAFLLMGKTTLAYFGATLLIGVCCEICARIMKRTATLFVTASIIPLVPGIGLYNTMLYVVEGDYGNAVQTGAATVLGICGIALAITMSSVLAGAFHPRKKEKPC
ncbi:MAG: threonine/serine exporter family protein [Deltaproteobacteria bacterium]|nr:threonine/serine exporter family protein [Deltaproteobacteria bacterium]